MKLRIEKAIYGGDGLARIPAGKTVFVPGTLPGELVEATIATDRRSFATGKLDSVLEPSGERVAPGCEYYPRCGGCQYQHTNPAFQLQMKLDILKETLERAHVAIQSEIASLAGPAWGYRNRIRLQAKGSTLGYRQRQSHKLLPVTHCPIAAPVLEQAIAGVERVAGLEDLCEEVEFFTNGEQDQLLISLWPGPRAEAARAGSRGIRGARARGAPRTHRRGALHPAKHEVLGRTLSYLYGLRNSLPGQLGKFFPGQSLSVTGIAAAGGEKQSLAGRHGISMQAPACSREHSISIS